MKLNNQNDPSYLTPAWPNKPDNVQAITTLVSGGYSSGSYSQFNLASHVGDDLSAVRANREKLLADLKLPSEPIWLEQVHSNKVIHVDEAEFQSAGEIHTVYKADASISSRQGVVCAVLTADCLPVFFCNRSGSEVAVAHAGWRGLHQGIISNTVEAMKSTAEELLVNLGPAIGAKAFEVGEEVFDAFMEKSDKNATAFMENRKKHYLCDIYQLARAELQSLGVTAVSGGDYCTYSDSQRFYSYRRQRNTGRMASLIWLN